MVGDDDDDDDDDDDVWFRKKKQRPWIFTRKKSIKPCITFDISFFHNKIQ